MEVRTKALVTVLLVGAFVGVYSLQASNPNLFKGELIKRDATPAASSTAVQLPDLTADLVIVAPAEKGGDISAKVTISNKGPGNIDGKKPFKYSVYINKTEVFSNTDSYSTMTAGDSFSFTYPISKAVYQYADSGTAKVVVDTDNAIAEGDENNNSKEVSYNLTK
ncbi:MAG: hypothetical protein NTZ25_03250 [Candidatus Peregrinibacteria bacterium]|nr:hypothetical protein [Candidatus Peregrinibacteria bacterium]